jgi:hypothetical protein
MPGNPPIYRSRHCEYVVTSFQKHPAYLSLSARTLPHLLFPNAPLPQSTWEEYARAEMQRVDAGVIVAKTLLSILSALRVTHMDFWGVDPPFFKSPLFLLISRHSVLEGGRKGGSTKQKNKVVMPDAGVDAKGLKHLVRYALSREWINDSSQWKALFPLSQSQVCSYIRSVFIETANTI